MHECEQGFAAKNIGMKACEKCPSGRTTKSKTHCLREDTPKDASEIEEGEATFVEYTKHAYMEVLYSRENDLLAKVNQISFVNSKTQDKTEISVLASRETGEPFDKRYEFSAMGVNATVAIPNEKKEESEVVYLRLIPLTVQRAVVVAKSELSYDSTVTLSNNVTSFNIAEIDQAPRRGVLLKTYVDAYSILDFKVEVVSEKQDLKFDLFYSEIPAMVYPNKNNANHHIQSSVGKRAEASFQLRDVEGGKFSVQIEVPAVQSTVTVTQTLRPLN
jgi:hypothetical protein